MPHLRREHAQTTGYFAGHVVLGLVAAALGPTLPALAAHVACEPEALGSLFTARGIGYMLGALSCGQLYDRRPAHPLLALAIATLAACTALVPLMPNRAALLGLMLVIGLALGLLDVGNNASLVRVHGHRVAPYMNALHCAYGVGAIISPFVVGAASTLGWAYGSLALASLPLAVALLTMPSPSLLAPSSTEPANSQASDSGGRPLLLLGFVTMLLFCQGAESGFGGWLFVIAQTSGLTDGDATRLVSGFWAMFTAGRVLSIAIATRVRPRHMLVVDMLGSALAVVLMLVIPTPWGLWIGTLLLGLALASVFPAALAFAGESMALSGAITSRIFVGASVGTITMPWLIGASFQVGALAPLLLVLGNLLFAGLVLALLLRFTARQTAVD